MQWYKMRYTKLSKLRSLCVSSSRVHKSHSRSFSVSEDSRLLTTTSVPISNLLQEYINSVTPSHGLKIHSHILKTGYQSNTNISIKLLILHLKVGSVSYARQLLEEMSSPTLSAYNYLLNAYVKRGKIFEAFALVHQMSSSGLRPDSFTHSLILKAWAALPRSLFLARDFGRQVHAQIIHDDSKGDVILTATLIDSYVKSERIDYARRVFDMMLIKNVMCSTSLISGYMSTRRFDEAETMFKSIAEKDVVVFNAMIEGYSKSTGTAKKSVEIYISMRRLSFLPTVSTFVSLLGACSLLASAEICQQVHSHLMKTRYFIDVKIGSAVIDMYSKCGNVNDARRIFDYMPEKNVFSWTSMIDGYGKNGKPSEVIEMFTKMQEMARIKPNYVTFLCAISACAYAGLVDKGWEIFESMERKYSLKPRMEHYACMVDLLGRSGRLEQAWEFVMKMPEIPNSDVWAALLSSARLQGEMEMAGVAADELFKLGADSRPGSYMALSNSLAEAGKWDRVDEVREMMKLRKISKDTGFSWTGVDDSEKKEPIRSIM
ncbi:pentatricopeptide repeat-containing protein At1g28690, mitochondrial-like [Silene latifolia]|uniref:pentatricopeptide repeat-containing protein At1g28690, mitochondrial-like n=1 Tax=Silene latifolia TaxID=37657 RepID=UPI003D770AA7